MLNEKKQKTGNLTEAARFSKLVDYQKGSIVSRTLIDKKTGTVTVFAFDENEALSEHTAPFEALVYVFDGEAEVVISGKLHMLKADEIIILPANLPHSVRAIKKFKMMLIMIRA